MNSSANTEGSYWMCLWGFMDQMNDMDLDEAEERRSHKVNRKKRLRTDEVVLDPDSPIGFSIDGDNDLLDGGYTDAELMALIEEAETADVQAA